MDKKKLEEMRESSAMKMFSETQARLASLSLATGSIDSLLKIAHDLDHIKKLFTHTATQDLLSKLSQAFPSNNLVLGNETTKIMKEFADSPLLNSSIFDSLKINKSLLDAIEATHLGLKPKAQFIFPEGLASESQIGDLSSIMSKATEALKQYDQLSELESFKALSRLENFPFDIIATNDSDSVPNLKENASATVLELDSKISDELSTIDDFNKLSTENQNFLVDLYRNYYSVILDCLIVLLWWKNFLDEKIDLSKNTFVFVKHARNTLSYIGVNKYRPNLPNILDAMIVNLLFQILF